MGKKARLIYAVSAVMSLCLGMPEKADALTVKNSVLYDKLIFATVPYLYGTKVLFQSSAARTYRLNLLEIAGKTASEIRSGDTTYLWPLDFGGSHAVWVSYSGSGTWLPGGGSGGGTIPGPGIGGLPFTTSVACHVDVLDISSKAETKATADTSYKECVAVDGKNVVWTDYRYFSSEASVEVYLYAVGGTEKRITQSSGYKANPHIADDKIVWQDYCNAGSNAKNADIYLYDIAQSKETAICTQSSYQDQPCVSGNVVVWQDYRNSGSDPKNADIYAYYLSENKEIAICVAPGYQGSPEIFGNIIVWQDFRNAATDSINADIYLHNLATRQEHVITTKAGYQGEPTLHGTNVVWMDFSDRKIYIAEIDVNSRVFDLGRTTAAMLHPKTANSSGLSHDLLGRLQLAKSSASFSKLVFSHTR